MKIPQIIFVGRQVRASLRELFWTHLLTSGTMAMTLFIFGAFVLLQENLESLLKGWGDQIQMYAYLETDLSAADTEALLTQVRALPEVESVRYISKEQAWEDFRKALGPQSSVLEGLPPDILPSSFEIAIKPAQRDQKFVERLAGRLRGEQGIAAVEYPQEWVEKLSLVVLGLQWAKWIFGGVLFAATYLIVGSTVRLAIMARKEEIEIMQLVGAQATLIRAPFVLEGLIQGTAGGLLSILGLWLFFVFLRSQAPTAFGLFGPLGQIRFLDFGGIALLLALGWLMGGSGSLFSVRRFLRTWGR